MPQMWTLRLETVKFASECFDQSESDQRLFDLWTLAVLLDGVSCVWPFTCDLYDVTQCKYITLFLNLSLSPYVRVSLCTSHLDFKEGACVCVCLCVSVFPWRPFNTFLLYEVYRFYMVVVLAEESTAFESVVLNDPSNCIKTHDSRNCSFNTKQKVIISKLLVWNIKKIMLVEFWKALSMRMWHRSMLWKKTSILSAVLSSLQRVRWVIKESLLMFYNLHHVNGWFWQNIKLWTCSSTSCFGFFLDSFVL